MDTLFPRLDAPDDAPALTVEGRTLGARALASACAAITAHLREKGVEPGDTVAVWAQPALETLAAMIATTAAGYVTLPLDPKLGARELEHIARDANPHVALAADPGAVSGLLPGVATMRAELGAADPAAFRARPLDPASPALVLYTSGTTGAPKGALVSSASLAFDLDALADAWAWTAADTVVHALPLFHVHGLVLGLFGALRRGGRLRWVPRFSPEGLAAALGEEAAIEGRSAVLFAVPTMHHRLADAAERDLGVRDALASARLLVSGSAALPAREHARLERLTGQRVVERYGLTETLINTAMRHDGARTPGLVGPPLPGVALRLLDEAGAPLVDPAPDVIGEIAVRGPNVFLGYLNRPDATAEVRSDDGWFRTGDLATLEPDGAVRIVGRKATDLVKCGGFKVGAGEVEAALLEHPSVREAAVIGAPDPDLGERIVAFVVTEGALDAQALADHVARLLSPHKRPREVHRVAALPRNAMGKVQKRALAALLAER